MLRISIFIFLSLFLHGCAYLQSMSSDLPEQIDKWAAAHEYGKALDTLSHVSKDHKYYSLLKRKKKHLLIQVKEFEHDQHLAAQKQENKGNWHKAEIIYTNALDKLPDSKLLNTEYRQFTLRRDNYLKNLEFKLSIAKGTWLMQSTPLQKKIVNAAPGDYDSQRRFKKNSYEIQETAEELMTCAESALQAGRLSLAETCLKTAEGLNSKQIDIAKLKNIRKEFNRSRHRYIKKQNDKTRALLKEIKQGYSHDNLLRAQHHLNEIAEHKKRDREAAKLARELDKYIKTGFSQRMEAGRRLYSNGQIEEALSIWIPLKSIDPNNTKLQDHIERAKRVLKKLEKLSNSKSTIPIPR